MSSESAILRLFGWVAKQEEQTVDYRSGRQGRESNGVRLGLTCSQSQVPCRQLPDSDD